MTSAINWPRAAMNRYISASASICMPPKRSTSRMRSPSSVPPGSRTTTALREERASPSSSACVVLPEPSTPSNVMKSPRLKSSVPPPRPAARFAASASGAKEGVARLGAHLSMRNDAAPGPLTQASAARSGVPMKSQISWGGEPPGRLGREDARDFGGGTLWRFGSRGDAQAALRFLAGAARRQLVLSYELVLQPAQVGVLRRDLDRAQRRLHLLDRRRGLGHGLA